MRSGNLLYDPATEAGSVAPFGVQADGQLFRVYTQVQFGDEESARCALWLVDDQQRLLYRYWAPLDEENATDWQVVASGVVNRDEGTDTFSLDSSGRTLTAVMLVNPDLDHQPGGDAALRDRPHRTQHVVRLPENVCDDLPPDM